MKAEANHRQTELRREVVDFVGQEAIDALPDMSGVSGLRKIFHIWLSVFVAVLLVQQTYVHLSVGMLVLVTLLAMLLIATRINALNVLLHEASHYCLFKDRRSNDLAANWLIGYWILFDIQSYRKVHLKHHRFLNLSQDPDLPLYQKASRKALVAGLLCDMLLVTFVKRAAVYMRQSSDDKPQAVQYQKQQVIFSSLMKVTCQLLILTDFYLLFGGTEGAMFYLLLWFYPLAAFYPVIIRWKTLVEHHADEKEEGVFVARSSDVGRVEGYLIGAEMQYHYEHHLFPELPFDKLKALHELLLDKGYFAEGQERGNKLSGGYVHFLKQHWRQCAKD